MLAEDWNEKSYTEEAFKGSYWNEKLGQMRWDAAKHATEGAASALQQLRKEIFEWGIIEFPGLPLNPTNYTLAQRAPQQHAYSSNPYLTDFCQRPHQDTPPYPTAFWLAAPRRYFATWVMGHTMAERFYQLQGQQPQLSVDALHEQWVARSLEEGSGL